MRPPAEIDFAIVDDMLEAGCNGVEVAARLGMHPDSLYRRVQEELGIGFAAYRQQKVASGDQKLRERLYREALSGDKSALIFLSKTRLGMKEGIEVEHTSKQDSGATITIGFRAPSDSTPGESKTKRKGKSATLAPGS